jgi:RimJ/RimL family protein N-acetyltransferase
MDFTLRPWKESDLENLVKHANNFEIAKNMMDNFPHPYTEEEGRKFIDMTLKNDPPLILAIDVEGDAVGSIGLHPKNDIQRKNGELGFWLSEDYWGKGIITEAIKRMVDYGFENLNIERIFARPFGTNIASQKALEKAGFRLEAHLENTLYKNEEYEDELIYAMRKKWYKKQD